MSRQRRSAFLLVCVVGSLLSAPRPGLCSGDDFILLNGCDYFDSGGNVTEETIGSYCVARVIGPGSWVKYRFELPEITCPYTSVTFRDFGRNDDWWGDGIDVHVWDDPNSTWQWQCVHENRLPDPCWAHYSPNLSQYLYYQAGKWVLSVKMETTENDNFLIYDVHASYRWEDPDFNSDGIVNFPDCAMLAGYWTAFCPEPDFCEGTDINRSGRVDLTDLRYVAANWLEGTISVLLVQNPGDEAIQNLLRSMGIEPVIQTGIDPSILAHDVVIVHSHSARDPHGYLRQMMQQGKGVITVGGTPYWLAGDGRLHSIADWLGAEIYTTIGASSTMEVIVEHEITTGVGLGTELWRTIGTGAATLIDLRATATVIAEWKPTNKTAAAILANEWDEGRSVYHSQRPEDGPETLDFEAVSTVWRNSILWAAGKI